MTVDSRRASIRGLVLPSAWAVGILIPLAYLVLTSLRTNEDYVRNPGGWPTAWTLQNYATAWSDGLLARAFINNVVVTALSIVGIIILGSAAAYGISRWTSRWAGALRIYVVLGLIVPFQLGLPTLYRIWVSAGLDSTLYGAALVHVGATMPLAIFLYLGFLQTVPRELEEAGRLDGAGEVKLFISIVFPLLAPITATLIILSCIFVWNDLLVSIFFLQDTNVYTLPRVNLSLSNSLQSDIPALMASAVIAVIPVIAVFVALQKSFLAGLTAGAVRG